MWGKRTPERDTNAKEAVHPHACGENIKCGTPCPSPGGSPPRVWGKRGYNETQTNVSRFTPTRVGKTSPMMWRVAVVTVHPHACGENIPGHGYVTAWDGSPPRVWGKLDRVRSAHPSARFTPTRVGKTVAPCSKEVVEPGSPPRVWGKLPRLPAAGGGDRFTPTRVGKTGGSRAN